MSLEYIILTFIALNGSPDVDQQRTRKSSRALSH